MERNQDLVYVGGSHTSPLGRAIVVLDIAQNWQGDEQYVIYRVHSSEEGYVTFVEPLDSFIKSSKFNLFNTLPRQISFQQGRHLELATQKIMESQHPHLEDIDRWSLLDQFVSAARAAIEVTSRRFQDMKDLRLWHNP